MFLSSTTSILTTLSLSLRLVHIPAALRSDCRVGDYRGLSWPREFPDPAQRAPPRTSEKESADAFEDEPPGSDGGHTPGECHRKWGGIFFPGGGWRDKQRFTPPFFNVFLRKKWIPHGLRGFQRAVRRLSPEDFWAVLPPRSCPALPKLATGGVRHFPSPSAAHRNSQWRLAAVPPQVTSDSLCQRRVCFAGCWAVGSCCSATGWRSASSCCGFQSDDASVSFVSKCCCAVSEVRNPFTMLYYILKWYLIF